MLSVATDAQAGPQLRLTWTSWHARVPDGCSPTFWRPRSTPTSPPTRAKLTSAATGWWCATGTPRHGRCRWAPARSRSPVPAWTTGAPTLRPAGGCGSRAQSCRAGCAARRRSPRCCRCCTCTGLSTGDFVPALREFFGSSAGLSASTVGRLVEQWQAEHAAFSQRDLPQVDYVYCWADGIHSTWRLADGRLCALVIVGGPRRRDQRADRGRRGHARVHR